MEIDKITYEDILWARKVLGLGEEVRWREVREKYRQLVKKYHPDVNPSPDSTGKIADINKAFEILETFFDNYRLDLSKEGVYKQLDHLAFKEHFDPKKWFNSI